MMCIKPNIEMLMPGDTIPNNAFDLLIVLALTDRQTLCVRGAYFLISKHWIHFKSLNGIRQFLTKATFCDMVWLESEEVDTVDTWTMSPKGGVWLFGTKVLNEFAHSNSLKFIYRLFRKAEFLFDQKPFTVLSAPNYCYCGNIASILASNNGQQERTKAIPGSPGVSTLLLPEPWCISFGMFTVTVAQFLPSFTPNFFYYHLQYAFYWAFSGWNAACLLLV